MFLSTNTGKNIATKRIFSVCGVPAVCGVPQKNACNSTIFVVLYSKRRFLSGAVRFLVLPAGRQKGEP